jgi:hypothetical protein
VLQWLEAADRRCRVEGIIGQMGVHELVEFS